ncbi:plasma-membrane proton-efflux P-type ATPase [Acidiferrobacter sp.]|uniref:plasma-membrane proton-efflux P-type ATPase n=1 Tax=Acidiferrobacter sp. TaxID=1872107 RepID=UPI002634FC71|nr:plasma-membrane proton-efflux P-type ATPase [Acidiferrobacter sp.]
MVTEKGLNEAEAQRRLQQYGPNAIIEKQQRIWLLFLQKFWDPVPWMLEVTLILEMILGKWAEAVIIAMLLVFNAVLGFRQEHKAQAALDALKKRLHITARVFRDGQWRSIPARDLVPGDLAHVRVGDIVPADMALTEGAILVDQSALTGESMPVDRGASSVVYSASIVRRGEASGTITATGTQSYFGKTAELVRTAGSKSHLEELVLGIVRYLVFMDGFLVVAILIYATVMRMPLSEILPFALILFVASVPVALPATFTLATAMASLGLAQRGVLVTRLAAIEEAAAMSDLCSDKTGTLTENRLSLAATKPMGDATAVQLLSMAAVASDDATQDPIDLTLLAAAREQGVAIPPRDGFTPFDPATKRSEALLQVDGVRWQAMKGAPQVITALTKSQGWERVAETLAAQGARVLGVAAGPVGRPEFVGLVGLADPIRPDALQALQVLRDFGVRVRMVTGDNVATAKTVAATLGLTGEVCDRADIGGDCAVYAEVFPEDKFHLVQRLQQKRKIVGMTGDGVNDAPALRQAEVGIAVESATDVAKAAASLVLTNPGLSGVADAVETGRRVYQRLLTYTLNKIVKTFQVALFLSLGLLVFQKFVITPILVLLLLFANDFVTMSLASDHVRPSQTPDRWDVRALIFAALVVAMAWTAYIFGVYAIGQAMGLPVRALQTLDFLGLVFSGLANVLLVRERGHIWHSRPGALLLLAIVLDTIVVSLLADYGLLMARIPLITTMQLLGATILYTLLLDQLKVPLLGHRKKGVPNGPATTAGTSASSH